MNLFEYFKTNSHHTFNSHFRRSAQRPAQGLRPPLLSTRELRDEVLRMVG